MRFATGWVPSEAVDTLGSRVEMDLETGKVTLVKEDDNKLTAALTAGRRQVLFGPEGFREAPKNHRLAIFMGSSADKYFGEITGGFGGAQSARSLQDLLINLQS